MAEVPRMDGTEYQDLDTAYGEMSRLVVAWLACTPPDGLWLCTIDVIRNNHKPCLGDNTKAAIACFFRKLLALIESAKAFVAISDNV